MSRHDPDPDARIAALLMQVDASLARSREWIAARGGHEDQENLSTSQTKGGWSR
ncbi:MAG: hypothetical protein ABW182_13180 [Sphingomonas sp.]